MMRGYTLTIVALLFAQFAGAQSADRAIVPIFKIASAIEDSMLSVSLDEAVVIAKAGNYKKFRQRYLKTEKKVLKVYPYAKAAGELMQGYEAEMKRLKTDRERKKYLEKAEEELIREFEGDIKNMTISEGLILIKLIDRETGDSSYDLIKELRGSFNAFVWQSLARLFGTNLKEEYDPVDEDRIIEDIVQRIENGELCVPEREVSIPESSKNKRKR
jgi:hypothetical protein